MGDYGKITKPAEKIRYDLVETTSRIIFPTRHLVKNGLATKSKRKLYMLKVKVMGQTIRSST